MAYTDIDDPSAYFQTTLYTGNASAGHAITNSGNSDLAPNWVWIKSRDDTSTHRIYDTVRGVQKPLKSDFANAEGTDNNGVTAFGSDGFTLGNEAQSNGNTLKFVSWNWKAGTSFTNDASGTGIGTIDSTGSFNNDAGFSIVTYSGTGSNGTIKHGLNAKPKIIIWKRTDNNAGAVNWIVQSTLFGNQTKLVLNTTEAFSTNSSFSQTNNWTSSVIDLKTYEGQNASNGTYVAYCFAEKSGFSKVGSYIGNGNADGSFIWTGQKSAFVMVKRSVGGTGHWMMLDNKRSASGGFNVLGERIKANATDAGATDVYMDFLASGFKFRTTTATSWNDSGSTYIFMSFAENPFTTSTGVPATAR